MLKMTLKEFVARATSVHGRKYDYSESIYEGTDQKLVIICKEHGKFPQTPYKHLRGQGCKDCGYKKTGISLRKSQKKFEEDVYRIHGNSLDVSQSNYQRGHTSVQVLCRSCRRTFDKTPANLTHKSRPQGCPFCNNQKVTDEYNLALAFPALCEEWHWLLNKNLQPSTFFPQSNKAVAWKCKDCSHAWTAIISNRTKKINPKGCPACSGRVATHKYNFATAYPSIASQFDSSKNAPFTTFTTYIT
jgi:rubrerythrin